MSYPFQLANRVANRAIRILTMGGILAQAWMVASPAMAQPFSRANILDAVPHFIRCTATALDGQTVTATGSWKSEGRLFSGSSVIERDGVKKCLLLSVEVKKNWAFTVQLSAMASVLPYDEQGGACLVEFGPEKMIAEMRVTTWKTEKSEEFGQISCWKI